MTNKLTVSEARPGDARDLFDWRNDQFTRDMSLHSDIIPWQQHEQWFSSVLGDTNRDIYIFSDGQIKVGMGRIDRHDGEAELSWMVAPMARGKGYGARIVKWLFEREALPKIAKIKSENAASIKIAESVGFRLERELHGIRYYRGEM